MSYVVSSRNTAGSACENTVKLIHSEWITVIIDMHSERNPMKELKMQYFVMDFVKPEVLRFQNFLLLRTATMLNLKG